MVLGISLSLPPNSDVTTENMPNKNGEKGLTIMKVDFLRR